MLHRVWSGCGSQLVPSTSVVLFRPRGCSSRWPSTARQHRPSLAYQQAGVRWRVTRVSGGRLAGFTMGVLSLQSEYVFHVFQNSSRIDSICIQQSTRSARLSRRRAPRVVRGAQQRPHCPPPCLPSPPPVPPPRSPYILRSSSSELSESESVSLLVGRVMRCNSGRFLERTFNFSGFI